MITRDQAINVQAHRAGKQPGNHLNYIACLTTEVINSREGNGSFRVTHQRMLRLNLEGLLIPTSGPTEAMAALCNRGLQSGGNKDDCT